jgi:uncharacterized protein (TIGR03437 family)
LNDNPAAVTFTNANQINFIVPQGFATGPATLRVTTAAGAAFPVILQIDAPPPVITSVTGAPAGASASQGPPTASAGDTLQLIVTGLDAAVVANFHGRLRVTIAGQEVTVQQVTVVAAGIAQVQVVLNQSFGAGPVPLVVWVDGSASAPVNIVVR